MLKEILKSIRKSKGYTQDDVASFLDIKRQTYSAYERGISLPDPHTINKLAKFFDVSSDYLLGTTVDPTPKDKQEISEYAAAKVMQNKLADVGIDISNPKEQETLMNFIEVNKDILKKLMDKE